MKSEIATTLQKATVNDKYLLAHVGGHNQLSSIYFV